MKQITSLRTWALWVRLDLQVRWHPNPDIPHRFHPRVTSHHNSRFKLPPISQVVWGRYYLPNPNRTTSSNVQCGHHPMCPENTLPETITIHPPFEGVLVKMNFVLPFGGICIHPFLKGRSTSAISPKVWWTPQAGKSSVRASDPTGWDVWL